MLMPLGDPLWKVVVLAAAVIVTLILSLSIFHLPLRKLQELIDKIPLVPCIIMDSLIFIAATVVNILTA